MRSTARSGYTDYDNRLGIHFWLATFQQKVTGVVAAVTVPAVAMLPAVVQVHFPVGLPVKHPPRVVSNPTGILKPVIAAVPLMLKYGPDGVIALAADATVPVCIQVAGAESGFDHPGAHVPVCAEHNH